MWFLECDLKSNLCAVNMRITMTMTALATAAATNGDGNSVNNVHEIIICTDQIELLMRFYFLFLFSRCTEKCFANIPWYVVDSNVVFSSSKCSKFYDCITTTMTEKESNRRKDSVFKPDWRLNINAISMLHGNSILQKDKKKTKLFSYADTHQIKYT